MTPPVDERRRNFLIAAGVTATTAGVVSFAGSSPVGASPPTEWRNVKVDHGALGNGTGDDRAAIQAAIDAAAALGTGTHRGGVAYLPPGTYPVGGSVLMRTGVVLAGAGIATQIQLKSGFDVPAIVIEDNADATPSAYTVVKDMTLIGSTPSHTPGRHGIAVRSDNSGSQTPSTGSDSFILLSNLLVEYFGGHGLGIGLDNLPAVANVRAIRCSNIIVWECARAAVSGDRAGFYIRSSDGLFSSCFAAGCSGPGFHLVRANNQLTDCKAYFNRHEFLVQGKPQSTGELRGAGRFTRRISTGACHGHAHERFCDGLSI